MALLGRKRGSSAMAFSPRNTASVFPTRSSLDLLPPAGDADPWLHGSCLSPRPHRPVSTGSLETEPSLARLASSSSGHGGTPTPHVFPRLFEVQELASGAGIWQLGTGSRKRSPPRPRGKGFTRQMIELEAPSARQRGSGLTKFIKILLAYLMGFDKSKEW